VIYQYTKLHMLNSIVH